MYPIMVKITGTYLIV